MKKTFTLVHPKKKPSRMADAIRNEIKKYLKRERHKTLPEKYDFWDFACKYGATPEEAIDIEVYDIGKYITRAEEQKLESFYLEIMAKPGHKPKTKK